MAEKMISFAIATTADEDQIEDNLLPTESMAMRRMSTRRRARLAYLLILFYFFDRLNSNIHIDDQ